MQLIECSVGIAHAPQEAYRFIEYKAFEKVIDEGIST
jgi:hypothetical protein